MLHKIVVATTSLEPSHLIFDHALMLAKATDAHLGILYVTDPDETDETSYMDSLNSLKPYMSGDESDPICYAGHLESLEPDVFGKLVVKATAEGVSTNCVHCFGDPERAISDFASAWNADLIVIGRRGVSSVAEFFLGSISNYTLHHAPCSVYVVQESPATNPEKSSEQTVQVPL
jgi:nucleotide-binding universal stress UspA family protein